MGWPLHPGRSGGEIRDFHLLRHLLTLSRVEFFALHGFHADGRADALRPRVDALHTPDTVTPPPPIAGDPEAAFSLGAWIRAHLRRRNLPFWGARYAWDTEAQRPNLRLLRAPLEEALARLDPDFFFVSPQTNPAALFVDARRSRARRIMASYDVEAVRLARFVRSERGLRRLALSLEARRAARFERENLAQFDGIIAVSELDRAAFVERYRFPPERVLVIENGVDPGYFAFHERSRDDDGHVVFVGALSYLANEQAAWRLVRRIMPIVRRARPRARLSLVGQGTPEALRAEHDGRTTVVTGTVPDVRPYLAAATVACVPLIAGSGTKYKVLEALSAGLPVVCTPLATEGLPLESGRHLLVEETDEGLAGAILRVLDDPALARRLAEEGRREVEARHSWDANLPRLGGWLEQLRSMPRRQP